MTRHRRLAHDYRDELPPPRPTIEPIVTSWREGATILVQTALLGAGLFAFLVLLLSMGGPS